VKAHSMIVDDEGDFLAEGQKVGFLLYLLLDVVLGRA
jgi:hypothetical protein